jgi:hypothetical protein
MGFEADSPTAYARITVLDPSGEWQIDARLTEDAGVTTLVFTQPLSNLAMAESKGPGWEWYLDMLLASRIDQPLPDFDDYYPAQAQYYAGRSRRRGRLLQRRGAWRRICQ